MARPLSPDILVIGAGTAGSVVASRLSADPWRRVILVEAGPADADESLHAPTAWPSLVGGAFDWGYVTAPQAALGGRLTANDPLAPARIDPNYLSAPEDMARFIAAVRLARQIGAQPALAPWSAGERLPGPLSQSDDDLRDFARRAVTPFYHPVGTCRMGREGRGVVDTSLRVHRVRGLRLADASIIPVIPNAMPNAAVVAIGLKAAQIVADAGL